MALTALRPGEPTPWPEQPRCLDFARLIPCRCLRIGAASLIAASPVAASLIAASLIAVSPVAASLIAASPVAASLIAASLIAVSLLAASPMRAVSKAVP